MRHNAIKRYNGVVKIISGGQIGAETAGLEFAKEVGIETGGYKSRIKKNIVESDGTIIFDERTQPGLIYDVNVCRKYKKPYLVSPDYERIIKWLNKNKIMVLNITGNKESVSPGISEKVKKQLRKSIING